MQIQNGTVYLKDALSLTVNLGGDTRYRDTDNNYISLPNKLIVRLYKAMEHYVKENRLDFEEYQESLFNKKDI